jgi:hypothetical protein
MPRVRVTVTNGEDRTEQLRIASRIRTEIINQLDVWLDDNSPLQSIHRDEEKRT